MFNRPNNKFAKAGFRFLLIGLSVTSLHFLIVFFLVEWSGWSPVVSNAIAFLICSIVSYCFNAIWSFSSKIDKETLFKFYIVSLLGLFVSIYISWMFENFGLDYRLGVLLIALILPVISFLTHFFWTFAKR